MYPLCCSTAEKLLFFHSLKGRKIVPSPSHPDTTDGGETVAGFGWLEMSPYGETLRAGRRPHNAIWSIWLYDGVCQIEGSAVAFTRQIQGASSRKCAHPSHLWTTDVCVQNAKWYVRRQLPIGITVGIRIPERGMMEEEGWPRTPDRCRSFFTFLKYQVPSRRSCLTLRNRTFTAAWKTLAKSSCKTCVIEEEWRDKKWALLWEGKCPLNPQLMWNMETV